MRHRVGAVFSGQFHQPLGDQRPRDGGAEQVLPFINRIGAEHREDEIAHEFLAHILDMDILALDPQKLGFLARRIKLLALAQIGGEGNDLAAIFRLQPFQDDRRIETTGIGKDDFLGRGHFRHSGNMRLTARAIPGFQGGSKEGDGDG